MSFVSSFPKLALFPLACNAPSRVRHGMVPKFWNAGLDVKQRATMCHACSNCFPQFEVLWFLYTHAIRMHVQEAQTGNTNLLTRKGHHVCPVCIANHMIMYGLPAQSYRQGNSFLCILLPPNTKPAITMHLDACMSLVKYQCKLRSAQTALGGSCHRCQGGVSDPTTSLSLVSHKVLNV